MFWKFGLEEDSLPVRVMHWLNCAWSIPSARVDASMFLINESR